MLSDIVGLSLSIAGKQFEQFAQSEHTERESDYRPPQT